MLCRLIIPKHTQLILCALFWFLFSDLPDCNGGVPNDDSVEDGGQNDCCDEDNPCGEGQGDCDDDNDCLDGLRCGNGNCGAGFYRGADCCERGMIILPKGIQ